MDNLHELNGDELHEIDGGSELSEALCWLFGAMFICPGVMARSGAAGHEIMGTK